MTCMVELNQALMEFEFNGKGRQQKIAIDILLKHGDFNTLDLATALDLSTEQLQAILEDKYVVSGEQATELSYLFFMFLGQNFFSKFCLIRNFSNQLYKHENQ